MHRRDYEDTGDRAYSSGTRRRVKGKLCDVRTARLIAHNDWWHPMTGRSHDDNDAAETEPGEEPHGERDYLFAAPEGHYFLVDQDSDIFPIDERAAVLWFGELEVEMVPFSDAFPDIRRRYTDAGCEYLRGGRWVHEDDW